LGGLCGRVGLLLVGRPHPDHNARELTQDIVAAVLDWAGAKGPVDDLTLIVLRKPKPVA
jgi:hypothetical protein